MTISVDASSEALITDLFDATFQAEVTKYLGLDSDVDRDNQPVDIEDLLHLAVGIAETIQRRNILRKDVTLTLPADAICHKDNKIFLPLGQVDSLTTFTYRDSDDATQTATGHVLMSPECSYIWAKVWRDVIPTLSTDHPEPITIAYTCGYSSFEDIPKSTIAALKMICMDHFENRGYDEMDMPQSVKTHLMRDALLVSRAWEYMT